MSFRLGAAHTNYDNLISKIRSLAQALDPNYQGMYGQNMGVIQWQPDTTSNPYYIDFYPSPMPTILDGTEMGLYKTLRLLQKPDGLKVIIWRHPYLRGPVLNASVNGLQNATLLEDGNNDGHPDRWFFDSLTGVSAESITFTSSVKAYQFTLATGNTRKLRQGTVNPLDSPYGVSEAASPGDVWSLSFWSSASGSGCTSTAVIEYLSAAGAVLQTNTGTGVTMTTSPQLSTVTGSAAPASTAFVRANLQIQNASGSNRVITMGDGTGQGAQLEKAAAPSAFRVGVETIRNDTLAERAPATAPSLAVGAAGNVNAGQHFYRVTFVTADGETNTGPSASVSPGVASHITVTNIPLGSNRITSRKLWRTKAAQTDTNANYFLVTTLNDNTNTSFDDNIADASLPAGNPNTAVLSMPPGTAHAWIYNPGNAPAMTRVTATPPSGASTLGVLYAARSTKDGDNLVGWNTTPLRASPLWLNATGSNGTAQAAAVDGSGGSVLTTDFSTGGTAMAKRWRLDSGANDAITLPGTYLVLATVRLSANTTGRLYRIKLRFGFATTNPLPFDLGDIILDPTNLANGTTQAMVPVAMGYITVPAGGSSTGAGLLSLEGWAAQDAGTAATLSWDSIYMMPSDEDVALIASPGFRSDGASPEVILGARSNATLTDFVNPTKPGGTALPTNRKGGQLILATLNDAAGTPPAGGTVLEQGRHVWTAHGNMYDTSQGGTALGELRVYNVTDNILVGTVPLTAKSGQTWTTFGDPGSTVTARVVADVPAANTKFYQAEVIFTHATTAGMKIFLSDITHGFVPTFGDAATYLSLEDDNQRAYSRTSTNVVRDALAAPQGFLELNAGIGMLHALVWEVAPIGYDSVDSRAQLPKQPMERSTPVGVNIIPRYVPL